MCMYSLAVPLLFFTSSYLFVFLDFFLMYIFTYIDMNYWTKCKDSHELFSKVQNLYFRIFLISYFSIWTETIKVPILVCLRTVKCLQNCLTIIKQMVSAKQSQDRWTAVNEKMYLSIDLLCLILQGLRYDVDSLYIYL